MDLFSVYNNINWSQSLSWKFCTEIGEERCFNSFWEDGKNWVFGEDRIPWNLTHWWSGPRQSTRSLKPCQLQNVKNGAKCWLTAFTDILNWENFDLSETIYSIPVS